MLGPQPRKLCRIPGCKATAWREPRASLWMQLWCSACRYSLNSLAYTTACCGVMHEVVLLFLLLSALVKSCCVSTCTRTCHGCNTVYTCCWSSAKCSTACVIAIVPCYALTILNSMYSVILGFRQHQGCGCRLQWLYACWYCSHAS